jgi:putative cardiolipin synthase
VGLGVFASASLVACSGGSKSEPRPVVKSYYVAETGSTLLGQTVAKWADEREGASGFELLTTGRDAFQSMVALVRLAEKTLDLQYYIWRADRTGRILLAELIAAADRGVRVRLLLDDMDLAWEDDELQKLSSHRQIEVRIFNPFANRDAGLPEILFDLKRINHRMHNKAFIADNSVAVIGGRNVGDRYFSVNERANYRDLDLYVAGRLVHEASASFDMFWNSEWSVPVAYIDADGDGEGRIPALKAKLENAITSGESPYDIVENTDSAQTLVARRFERLIWTDQARLLADFPNKPETKESVVLNQIVPMLNGDLQRELLLEMAYLIPGTRGVKRLCRLVDEGIKVRILTNSFQSNDVVAAYAGYRKFRESLVGCGVELFEMRTDADFVKRDWNWLKPSSAAYLHTKAAVMDGDYVLIGSFNVDPRSVELNTEIALAVRNKRLAEQVTKFITDGMKPANAYHLKLVDGELVWSGKEGDKDAHIKDEPGIHSWRGFITTLMAQLPIDDQL